MIQFPKISSSREMSWKSRWWASGEFTSGALSNSPPLSREVILFSRKEQFPSIQHIVLPLHPLFLFSLYLISLTHHVTLYPSLPSLYCTSPPLNPSAVVVLTPAGGCTKRRGDSWFSRSSVPGFESTIYCRSQLWRGKTKTENFGMSSWFGSFTTLRAGSTAAGLFERAAVFDRECH